MDFIDFGMKLTSLLGFGIKKKQERRNLKVRGFEYLNCASKLQRQLDKDLNSFQNVFAQQKERASAGGGGCGGGAIAEVSACLRAI